MDTIHVVLGAVSSGRFRYTIETVGTRLATPYKGLSAMPLLDACQVLTKFAAADADAVVRLYRQGCDTFLQQTTIDYMIKHAAGVPTDLHSGLPGLQRGVDALKPLMASGVAEESENAPAASVSDPRAYKGSTSSPSARSSAKPPPRHKRQVSPAGKDPAEPKPARPKRSPRKPKPAKSAAPPARRSGR